MLTRLIYPSNFTSKSKLDLRTYFTGVYFTYYAVLKIE